MYQVFKKEFMKLVIKCIEQNFSETSEISIAGTDTMVKWVYILFFNLSDYKTFYTQLIYPPPPKAIYSKRAWFYVKIREIQRRELYLVVR